MLLFFSSSKLYSFTFLVLFYLFQTRTMNFNIFNQFSIHSRTIGKSDSFIRSSRTIVDMRCSSAWIVFSFSDSDRWFWPPYLFWMSCSIIIYHFSCKSFFNDSKCVCILIHISADLTHMQRKTAALYLSLSHTGLLHRSAAGFGGQIEKKQLH